MAAPRPCLLCARKRKLLVDGLCRACRERAGLPHAPTTSPRPLRPCARCGHGQIVACHVRQPVGPDRLVPVAAAYPKRLKTPILTGEEEIEYDGRIDAARPIATFVAYVCRACGFTEWYALDPAAIPIGPPYGTELVAAPSAETPYR